MATEQSEHPMVEVPEVHNCDLMNSGTEAKKYSRAPARDSSWKGRFEFLDGTLYKPRSGFEARPCSRGLRKLFDYSKRMPQILRFKLFPQKVVCKNIFQDDSPDEDDIGIYFYFRGNKRTSYYDYLLASLDALDVGMRCDMAGIELYVFTSKILPADYQKLGEEYFLWGVFREVEKQNDDINNNLADTSQNSYVNNDGGCVTDMEIDMLAGKDIGKIDVVVPRDSSSGANSSMGHVNSLAGDKGGTMGGFRS